MENKIDSKETYTLGIWKVKPGKETDFINAWTSFAKWTNQNCSGSGKAYLLRDENDSSRFISFSPWDSENSIRKWRDHEVFTKFVTNVKTLCDDFQPNTMKVVSASI